MFAIASAAVSGSTSAIQITRVELSAFRRTCAEALWCPNVPPVALQTTLMASSSIDTIRSRTSPGSLLLGNAKDGFICSHEHGTGDRCVSFFYTEEFRAQLEIDAGKKLFNAPRIPAIREFSALTTDDAGLMTCVDQDVFVDVAIRILSAAVQAQYPVQRRRSAVDAGALARVTRVLREIESRPGAPHDLNRLAEIARLSPYHFLRTFRALTGASPISANLRIAFGRLKQ
jgi:AraC family transcriptional regulator